MSDSDHGRVAEEGEEHQRGQGRSGEARDHRMFFRVWVVRGRVRPLVGLKFAVRIDAARRAISSGVRRLLFVMLKSYHASRRHARQLQRVQPRPSCASQA